MTRAWAKLCLVLSFALASCATLETPTPQYASHYIAMRDGVRLAVDVWTPSRVGSDGAPAVIFFTRYWRSRVVESPALEANVNYQRALRFADAGYALVLVDVRGSGASFGVRDGEFSPDEIADFGEVISWVAAQSWSNGRVATMGSSYLGNTAELAAINGGDALRAAVPRFSDFDLYRYAVYPGGVPNTVLLGAWGDIVGALDRNDPCIGAGADCDPRTVRPGGVRPVDGYEHALEAAVGEHRANLDVTSLIDRLRYADDSAARDGDPSLTLSSVSPSMLTAQIDRAAVPMEFWVSWFDAATAEGALSRFMTYQTPMRLIIGPWNHGASLEANPYATGEPRAAQPSVEEQYQQIFDFLDPLVGEGRRAPIEREIRYYTLGVDTWRATDTWPPLGVRDTNLYLSAHAQLLGDAPTDVSGADAYVVDFSATTGEANRWTTQIGAPVAYGDRAHASQALLHYTTPPLIAPLEITGNPIVELWMSSTTPDAALHVYLEDVAPDGRVTYLTEGILRLAARRVSETPAPFHVFGPYHTFARADAEPMPAGRNVEVTLALMPLSVVLQADHRIRLSIAGADAGSFARIPAEGGAPRFEVARGASTPSRLRLPIVGALALAQAMEPAP